MELKTNFKFIQCCLSKKKNITITYKDTNGDMKSFIQSENELYKYQLKNKKPVNYLLTELKSSFSLAENLLLDNLGSSIVVVNNNTLTKSNLLTENSDSALRKFKRKKFITTSIPLLPKIATSQLDYLIISTYNRDVLNITQENEYVAYRNIHNIHTVIFLMPYYYLEGNNIAPTKTVEIARELFKNIGFKNYEMINYCGTAKIHKDGI